MCSVLMCHTVGICLRALPVVNDSCRLWQWLTLMHKTRTGQSALPYLHVWVLNRTNSRSQSVHLSSVCDVSLCIVAKQCILVQCYYWQPIVICEESIGTKIKKIEALVPREHHPQIGNGPWGIKWSHDRWCYETPKGQIVTPQGVYNSWKSWKSTGI